MRIGNFVGNDNKGLLAARFCLCKNIVKRAVIPLCGYGNDPLVAHPCRHFIKLFPIDLKDRNAALDRLCNKRCDRAVALTARRKDLINVPAARKKLAYGVTPCYGIFVKLSVYRLYRLWATAIAVRAERIFLISFIHCRSISILKYNYTIYIIAQTYRESKTNGEISRIYQKKKKDAIFASFFFSRSVVLASCGVASAAVNSLALGRIEGHFAFCATIGTNRIEHLSLSFCCGLSCCTALFALLGLVLEALLCIEFLLTGGEHELCAALFALQSLVLVHLIFPLLDRYNILPLDGFPPTPLITTLSLKLPGHIKLRYRSIKRNLARSLCNAFCTDLCGLARTAAISAVSRPSM